MQTLRFRLSDGGVALATLGLTHDLHEVGCWLEVYTISATWRENLPDAFTRPLLRALGTGHFRPGSCLGGAVDAAPGSVTQTGKTALYLVEPFDGPEEFASFTHGHATGRLLLGVFLTPQEEAFGRAHGFEALEARLEALEVYPYDLHRPSCV